MSGFRLVATLVGLLLLAANPVQADKALERAKEFLDNQPIIDGHNDLPWVLREMDPELSSVDLRAIAPTDTDIPRMRIGGVGGQFWSVYIPAVRDSVDASAAGLQLQQIDLVYRMIDRYPGVFAVATSASDIVRAQQAGRIASLLGIEGGHAIENNLGILRMYYRLGVRYMTLTHSASLDWADAAGQSVHGGLTPFGLSVVQEMNRLGMLVDLSHVSPQVMRDALETSVAPVIFSHSNAYALTPHYRNVPDDVLRRLPINGGLVMVSFVNTFSARGMKDWIRDYEAFMGDLVSGTPAFRERRTAFLKTDPMPRGRVADVADHIDYIAELAGIRHVGIGADYFGEADYMVPELADVSTYPKLFAELIRRGWSESELELLARGNILRVLSEAEQVADSLRQLAPTTAYEQ